ncbi:MAG: flagellar hook-associated protein FlgL [Tepidisphaerales bacterium]
MAILPLQTARVSNFLRSTISLSSIASTQRQLLEVQNQLATGQRIFAPSDDPGGAAVAIQLQRTLERQQAYSDNLTLAKTRLSVVDSALGDLTDILRQAESLASANVGSDVTAEQRRSAAAVARSLYAQALSLANRQVSGFHLFGGDRGTSAPFVETAGGVRFAGSPRPLLNTVEEGASVEVSVPGDRVFGGYSERALGVDLEPHLTASTRLSDLRGASNLGVAKGSILISDGTESRLIDLSKADTIGDVLNIINASGLVTASITGDGLTLSGSPTQNLTVVEVGGNTVARDLGILRTVGLGPGVPVNGDSVSPRVTPLTPISALRNGLGLDLPGGLRITNGTAVYNIDFVNPPVTTVQELINRINSSGSGALAKINDQANGIDIVSPTQGVRITVGNNGGTLATELGVRSMSPASPLSQLNFGRGVQTASGADIRITDRTGAVYDIDLTSAVTVQDVMDLINTATGGNVVASFSSVGNGIVLTDTTSGTGNLSVQSINFSTAAADLGIAGSVAGSVLSGTDVNPVRARGVFDHLLRLANALEQNDQREITLAAAGLREDLDRVVRVRGETGARVREVEARTDSLEVQRLATQAMLSEVKDTDYPATIARFQLLQTTLQANYQTTARVNQLSLLDFLR